MGSLYAWFQAGKKPAGSLKRMKTMNSKRAITGLAATIVLLGISTTGYANPRYDYAKVISAQPILRYVTVRTPVRECWNEHEYYTLHHRHHGTGGGSLAGAIIGGVIGHQFGSGRGRDAATIAGSLLGAAIGHNADHRYSDGYANRCTTRYREHRESRIDGYQVVYRYKGQKYSTRMPHDPGRRIRIRVDIRPVV